MHLLRAMLAHVRHATPARVNAGAQGRLRAMLVLGHKLGAPPISSVLNGKRDIGALRVSRRNCPTWYAAKFG